MGYHLENTSSPSVSGSSTNLRTVRIGGIREDDENGASRNWGDHGNLDLHGWAFDRFTTLLDYKAEAEGVDVELVSERDTSKSCSACGHTDDNQRVERGLYVCEECDTVANADVNGAESIRQKVLRVSPRMAVIGITAGWHSQRFTCSTVVRVFSPHENRS